MSEERAPWERPQQAETAPWERVKQQAAVRSEEQQSLPEKIWTQLKGAARGLAQGGMETAQGTTQLLSRAIPGQAGQRAQADIGQQIQQAQQGYQASPARMAAPTAADIGRVGGQVAATAPMMALPMGGGLAARAGMGAVGGALGAATQPVERGDFWTEKGKQLAAGAATGGVLGGAGGMIGPALGPVQTAAMAFPNLMNMARGVEGRTEEALNRATARQVLDPIGAMIPPSTKAGHPLNDLVQQKASEAFDRVLPKLTFAADEQFRQAIQDALQEVKGTAQADRLAEKIQKFVKALDENGSMPGQKFKQFDSDWGGDASTFSARNATADNVVYARALRGLQAEARDALERTNANSASDLMALRNANQTWAMNLRFQDAAGRDIKGKGIFSPEDLLTAVRGTGQAAKRQFARGDRLMQGYAEAASDLINMRPTGMQRIQKLVADLGAMSAGGAIGHAVAGPVGGMAGMLGGHFGRAGMAAATDPLIERGFAATGTPTARGVGEAAQRAAPGAGAAVTGAVPYISPVGP